jgi:hypothetical protein
MRLSVMLLVAWSMAFHQGKPPAMEPGFTSLFNGKDLSGWKISGSLQSFTVTDGAIVASGPASHAYYDGAFRNHRFRNFELRLDVMARAGANGGVYVLTEFEEVGGNERASGRFPSDHHRQGRHDRGENRRERGRELDPAARLERRPGGARA